MYSFAFEKLEVWKDSKQLSIEIYRITRTFPSEEKFGLTSQLRRATISISSNIAEGSARKTKKDQAHFYVMAFSSAIEVLNQLILCFELELISDDNYFRLRNLLEKITNKLNALHRSISEN